MGASLVGAREEAAAQAQKNLSISDRPMRRGIAAWSLARGGKPDEAASIRRSLEALPADTPGRASGLVFARLGVEDWPGALTAIEDAAIREPELILALLMLSPPYDPIRSDPRFAAVIRQLNLDVDLFTRPDGGRSAQATR